jgi:hypothetical protein
VYRYAVKWNYASSKVSSVPTFIVSRKCEENSVSHTSPCDNYVLKENGN